MANKYWCYCVSLLCILQSATSFNLEPRIPVIKYGKPGSYFGFSVAEHMTVSPNANTSWLLVGAPLDQNKQPNTTKSGALWKCPLTPAVRDCDQVVTDGKQMKNRKINKTMDSDHLLPPDEATEIKNGQWLGVSVRSQGVGQKAVVCAHRYIRKDLDLQHGQGLCYTFSNDLQVNDVWESCRGRSVRREHEEFGLCQVGTSSSLLADNTLILGSPGPFTWRGTIFVHDSNEDLINRQYETYMGPVQDGFSPVEKYSYLGMSVTGAKFFSGNFSYASGAPRARGTGQVVIFSKQTVLDWSSDDVTTLNVSMILNGEQFGSSYGYEVAAGDVNGDGYPDLLVGAPFYFSRDAGGAVYLYLNDKYSIPQEFSLKLTGKPESQFGISIANAGDLNKDGCEDIAIGSPYEGDGVVYIHMGDRKNGLHSKPDQIIRAEHLPRKIISFGYSLSGGMDLDANGYPDLLAGAYENSTVVLLRARPIIDIKTAILPSNTILNVDPLTQGCEQDPESNYTCFHFEACCSIKSLVKSSQSNMHKVNYVIEAETFPGGRKYSRVFFGSNPTARKSHIVDRTFDLRTDVEECKRHIVYLKNSTRDIQTPIKFQLSYKLVHDEPRYSTVGSLPSIDEYPVLNATSTTTFTANFLNDCGSDGICISDLVVTPKLLLPKAEDGINYALTLGQDEEIKLAVFVDNYGESAYEAQLIVQHPASLHYIAADITDKHVICTSMNDTVVTCMLENPFKQQVGEVIPVTLRFDTIALEDHEPSIKFIVWANSTSKEKHPGKKPEQAEALVIKNAELSIKGVARPEQVFYGGDVKGETAMAYFDDIGPRVMHTYQVFNEGPWHVSNVRVVISWPHQVAAETSQGKWLLYPEDIPSVDGEDGNINGECFGTKSEINTLGISARPGTTEAVLENLEMDPFQMFHRSGKIGILREERNETAAKYDSAAQNKLRRKRDLDVITAEAYTDKDGHRKQIVNMNCQNKTAKCIQFQCVIYRLSRMQAVTITVKARLWNATLVEDYPRVGHVNIASSAVIHPPDNYNIHQNKRHDDSTMVETVAYPDLKISEPSEVPLWVIIVSVIVGLIVLVLLIIALWKLGFFKRSRPDPTLSGNLEKNNHEASPFIVRDRNSFR